MNAHDPHEAPQDGATTADARQPAPQRAGTGERGILYAVLILVLIVDQFTKYLIESNFEIFESWTPFPAIGSYFRVFHTYNTGAAFGLFPDGNVVFMILAVLVSLAIFFYNHTLPGGHPLLRLALGLQAGGALGNFLDRVRIGHVTDFLDINLQSIINVPLADWPVFNVADMSIVGGVIVLGWIMLQEERQLRAEQRRQQTEPDSPAPPAPHVDKRSAN